MSLTMERIGVVSASVADLDKLLNVADEQQFIQQFMCPEAVQECIEAGETNIAKLQGFCKKLIHQIMDENTKMYDALCVYFMKRSEAYELMHRRFTAIGSTTNSGCTSSSSDTNVELSYLQTRVKDLVEELAYWRTREKVPGIINERLNLIQRESGDLRKEINKLKEGLHKDAHLVSPSVKVQQLQTSLETSSKAVVRTSLFDKPYTKKMRAKVAKANFNYWQGFTYKVVPFLCDENGRYFVDWDNIDEQWKFGDKGKINWSENVGSSRSSVGLLACSLLLPRQFNADGLNNRVVIVWLTKKGTSLVTYMTHQYSPSANVTSTTVNCRFHLAIKHNDGTKMTELQEIIQCQVLNTGWKVALESGALPFTSFSTIVAPSLRVTLVPV